MDFWLQAEQQRLLQKILACDKQLKFIHIILRIFPFCSEENSKPWA